MRLIGVSEDAFRKKALSWAAEKVSRSFPGSEDLEKGTQKNTAYKCCISFN